MAEVEHKVVSVNGLNMHVAMKGPVEGPVVLLLHGFPGLWYSWRHQIPFLAEKGYRAVAPDLRGYGGTDAPEGVDAYTCFDVVGDLVALIDTVAKGEKEGVFVVGHDWGAIMAWCLCLARPDKVKALVNLSVPFRFHKPTEKPVDALRAAYGDDHYISRFQEYGAVEAEFAELGAEVVIKAMMSPKGFVRPGPLHLPKGFWKGEDAPRALPSWLSEEDLKYYAGNFEKKGFIPPLNYYRNLNRNHELLAPWAGVKVQVPVKFITGDQDLVYHMRGVKDYVLGGAFKADVPLLEDPVVMEGVAHFCNQEKPDEINHYIYEFLKKF